MRDDRILRALDAERAVAEHKLFAQDRIVNIIDAHADFCARRSVTAYQICAVVCINIVIAARTQIDCLSANGVNRICSRAARDCYIRIVGLVDDQ